MERLLTIALSLAVLAVAVITIPGTSQACSCLPLTPLDAFEQSDAVFAGRVLAIEHEVETEYGTLTPIVLEMKFYWKGEPQNVITVFTPSTDNMCGFTFQTDGSFLVYAQFLSGLNGTFTHLCSRTNFIENAEEDLESLGEPQFVTPVQRVTWGTVKRISM